VFDGGGYVATAVSLAPVRLLVVPRAALFEDLALRDVTARVAGYLADETRGAPATEVVLAETREEVAARLGTVRELVSRALARLRSEGVVALRGRRVRIVDHPRLLWLAGRPPAPGHRRSDAAGPGRRCSKIP
jgi:CRP-like cAMP-binding protein